jgi:hypothetical protein
MSVAIAPRRLTRRSDHHGYGRLRPAADEDSGALSLALPRGFRYHALDAPSPSVAVAAPPRGGAAWLHGVRYEGEDREGARLCRVVRGPLGTVRQALAVRARPGFDAAEARIGLAYRTEWVAAADLDGAATFPRQRGVAAAGGRLLIACPEGGSAGLGQLWAFTPRGPLGGLLTPLEERRVAGPFDHPALLATLPGGERTLLAAGGELRVRDGDGAEHPLARVLAGAGAITGASFASHGATLRLDVARGDAFAVRGPFTRG